MTDEEKPVYFIDVDEETHKRMRALGWVRRKVIWEMTEAGERGVALGLNALLPDLYLTICNGCGFAYSADTEGALAFQMQHECGRMGRLLWRVFGRRAGN